MDVVTEYINGFHSVCQAYDPHDSEPATVDLVCMLVAFLAPAVVVEAGTYRGRMALSIANILRINGSGGVVYTADPVDLVAPTFALPELASLMPHLQYHQGDYLEMLGQIPGEIDLAYIDASSVENPHMRWEHTMATYLRMKPDGLILIDDTGSDGWEDAAKLRDLAAVYLEQHRGLTIIQKRQPWL